MSENHQEIVSDALKELLRDEFNCDVILAPAFDPSRLTKGEYIRYWFTPSELVNVVHSGEYRNYNIEVCFYFDQRKKRLEQLIDGITDKVEQMKQLFVDNVSYIPGNFYKWHYLGVGNIDIGRADALEDIEETDVMIARIEIQITRGNF